MSRLIISLLGTPQVSIDHNSLKVPTTRALPLLAYLALNQEAQTRETLANLLWTESNQDKALAALRTMLWRLKRTALDEWIAWDRDEIYLQNLANLEIDVLKFEAELDRCDTHGHPPSAVCLYCTPALTQAVDLYRGEFMKGFNISKAAVFDDWRMLQSETLQSLYINALERLVKCHRIFGDFTQAIHYARIWLNVDRLNENSHIQLLQLYSLTGQKTAAISLFKHYKDTLYRELGILPTEEITSIYKQVISQKSVPVAKSKIKTPVILMADIEKPTLYWANIGEEKHHILSTYTNIIKSATHRFGGNILQKTEDNITILFESGQPLHFAINFHLLLKRADWGTDNPPNIRMVLYATSQDEDDSSNFLTLTQAASSLLSISWGGQIVFTDQTLKILDVPSGSTLKDLGFHYLNDTEGSVHVFELNHPNLPTTVHPPLLSRTQPLVNLPKLDPPFIGREQELGDLKQLVQSPSTRLITLIGPGGVGKTRLAVEFAAQVEDNFPDGVCFISFASIQDAEFIPILVADAMKFSFYGPNNHMEQLGKYLHRMKLLLVVDNFEHMRVEGARFLASLISSTQNLKFLVTSRERMNLLAESVLEVRGFPVPDSQSTEDAENFSSVRLFAQNARKTFPRFSDHHNLNAIIRICQIVDGIPLGILLASSLVRVFSCDEIASEINKNIDFLTSSAPDLDPRHRSLNAVFDNSWKLLSEEERRILRRLSIFKSSFSAYAAREICNASPLVLSTLTDKSLLYQQSDGRFIMLNTFNQYAAARFAEAENERMTIIDKFCEFYADYCAQKSEELFSRLQRNALDDMASEIENIRTAWGLMIDTTRWDLINKSKDSLLTYHAVRGNYSQGSELFNTTLSKLRLVNRPDQGFITAYMRLYAGWMDFRRGFSVDSLKIMEECLEIFHAQGSAWDIAINLYFMAEVQRTSGLLLEAKELIQESLAQMQLSSVPGSNYVAAMIAHCHAILGTVFIGLNDYDQAYHYLKLSLDTHQRIGSINGSLYPLVGLGNLAFQQGEFLHSRDLYQRALDIAIEISDHRGMIQIHNNLSGVYEAIANIPDSLHHLQTALKLCQDTGDRRLTAIIKNNLAYQQLRYEGACAESIHSYRESLALFSELGDLRGIAYTSYDISKAYIKLGDLEKAWEYCLRALKIAISLDNLPLILHTLHGFAEYFASNGKPVSALRICRLITSHPQVDHNTHDRAIVTQSIIETSLSDNMMLLSNQTTNAPVDYTEIIQELLNEKAFHFNNLS
jgi:predicted ATPase/DNA-binding SARP family transcriptional activator